MSGLVAIAAFHAGELADPGRDLYKVVAFDVAGNDREENVPHVVQGLLQSGAVVLSATNAISFRMMRVVTLRVTAARGILADLFG